MPNFLGFRNYFFSSHPVLWVASFLAFWNFFGNFYIDMIGGHLSESNFQADIVLLGLRKVKVFVGCCGPLHVPLVLVHIRCNLDNSAIHRAILAPGLCLQQGLVQHVTPVGPVDSSNSQLISWVFCSQLGMAVLGREYHLGMHGGQG